MSQSLIATTTPPFLPRSGVNLTNAAGIKLFATGEEDDDLTQLWSAPT